MPDLRLVGSSAAFAFVLSFITGLFGGVGFFTILLRAVIGAVAFGALIGGIYLLLEKMIPELFAGEKGEEDVDNMPAGEQGASGGNVDITLEGEDGDTAAAGSSSAGGEESVSEPAAVEGEAETAGAAEPEDAESADENEEFVEEVAETGSEAQSKEEQPSEEGESAESSSGESEEETDEEAEDVDTLPDLEDFAESFEGVAASQTEGEGGSSSGAGAAGGGASQNVDIKGDEYDPGTVAKAVRTIMDKDQEG